MKAALSHPAPDYNQAMNTSSCKGFNAMKPLVSDVGDIQKTSDKLMFALISIRFPSNYDEDL